MYELYILTSQQNIIHSYPSTSKFNGIEFEDVWIKWCSHCNVTESFSPLHSLKSFYIFYTASHRSKAIMFLFGRCCPRNCWIRNDLRIAMWGGSMRTYIRIHKVARWSESNFLLCKMQIHECFNYILKWRPNVWKSWIHNQIS